MKNKIPSNLWLYFASLVFCIMMLSAIIIFIITLLLFNYGYLDNYVTRPVHPILILLILSVIMGTIISVIIGRKIIHPLGSLNVAAKEVAKGNYNVTIDEDHMLNEIRELQHNFNLMIREVRSTEATRNDFVLNVSHEFKTPTAAIEGYATLLRDKEISDVERDEYTKMILLSTKRLSNLTNNILKLSKLENQELVAEKETYRIDEQIRQVILQFESEWTQKNIDWQIVLEKQYYHGNAELMEIVFSNLIGNAVKFSNDSGIIKVTLVSEREKLIICVADNGSGMSNDVKKHIFEKFYQGDNARSSDGNGLGLALVGRIIKLCKGDIIVTSEPSKGSEFKIILPF